MKYFISLVYVLVFCVIFTFPQNAKRAKNQNSTLTKVQNIKGSVYYYVAGSKKLLALTDEIVSDARFEVVDGIVEILVIGQLITATAGADFSIVHRPDYLKVTSNQGVPMEINLTSGHNLVLTSKAQITLYRAEGSLKISVITGRALMSDLRGTQETKILNAADTVVVTDIGLVKAQSKIDKQQKTAKSDFFKRFTKEEFEFFSLHDTNLKDLVSGSDVFFDNYLLGKRSYLKYFLFLGGLYDSNVYLTDTGKRNDYINRNAVGFKIKQSFENSYIYGGYRLDLLKYSKVKSLEATYHDAEVGFKIKFPGNFIVASKENYLATTRQESSEITFRTKRTQNDFKSFIEIPVKGRLGFRADLKHSNYNYSSATFSGLEKTIFASGGGFTYWFLPETLLYLYYQYNNLNYKNSTTHDCKYHIAGVSVERQLSPEVVGKVGAGFEFRDYDTDFILPPAKAENKPTTFVFDVQIVWKPYADSRVIFIGERKNVQTNVDGTFLNPGLPVELSRYYESTFLDLSWLHKIGKFDFGMGFGWEFADYPEINNSISKKRKDRHAVFRAQILCYINRWLIADATYNFASRSSNIMAMEYDAHEGGFGIKLIF